MPVVKENEKNAVTINRILPRTSEMFHSIWSNVTQPTIYTKNLPRGKFGGFA